MTRKPQYEYRDHYPTPRQLTKRAERIQQLYDDFVRKLATVRASPHDIAHIAREAADDFERGAFRHLVNSLGRQSMDSSLMPQRTPAVISTDRQDAVTMSLPQQTARHVRNAWKMGVEGIIAAGQGELTEKGYRMGQNYSKGQVLQS